MLCHTQHSFRACCPVQRRSPQLYLPLRAPAPKQGLCRWAPDSKDDKGTDAPDAPSSTPASSADSTVKDPMTSRRLINQLLQIQSLSSLQSMHSMQSVDSSVANDKELQDMIQANKARLQQQQQQQLGLPPSSAAESLASTPSAAEQLGGPAAQPMASESTSLFDDPAAADFDPLVLDMLGFTSVAQYLDSKAATAAEEAKVSVAAVLSWLLMAGAMVVPLGGLSTYTDSLSIFTDGGLEMGNLVFLWVAVLGYYSIKGCVMSFVMAYRAWRLHEDQGDRLEELAQTVEAQDQRRAFWKLQRKLQNADERANRTYAEFALASLLLGLLLLMSGGPDHLELQLETLDEEAYLKLLVVLWLFWETYFSTVGSVLKVSNWVSAVISKWQYTRKWGARAGAKSRR